MLPKGIDYLCCITNNDQVMKYDTTESLTCLHPKLKQIVYHFQDFCLIYPENKFAAAITTNELLVIEVATGDIVSNLKERDLLRS